MTRVRWETALTKVPGSDRYDATAAQRATDEGMPEEQPPTAEAGAADRAGAEAASRDALASDIQDGWVGPDDSDEGRGIEDDGDEHDLGGEG